MSKYLEIPQPSEEGDYFTPDFLKDEDMVKIAEGIIHNSTAFKMIKAREAALKAVKAVGRYTLEGFGSIGPPLSYLLYPSNMDSHSNPNNMKD